MGEIDRIADQVPEDPNEPSAGQLTIYAVYDGVGISEFEARIDAESDEEVADQALQAWLNKTAKESGLQPDELDDDDWEVTEHGTIGHHFVIRAEPYRGEGVTLIITM